MQSRMPEGYTTREQAEALLEEARMIAASPRRARARQPAKRTGFRRTAHALSNLLYAAIIALLLLGLYTGIQAKMHDQPAALFGYSLYVVRTGSMVPTLPIGSYIITRVPEDPAALSEGTVITFQNTEGSVITHRIVEVVGGQGVAYRTKGDNPLNDPDIELVAPERVLGTLQLTISLPRLWEEKA